MPCDRIDPLVTPFVDGELPDPDRRAVEDHLRVCPPCHSRVAAEREVHALIRARLPVLRTADAPDALHARCWAMARLTPETDRAATNAAPMPMPVPKRLMPYALAASLVLVVGGAFVYQATDKSARVMAAELTADHLKCFAMNRAFGTHDEAAAVESSMADIFDWRMHLPANPGNADLELVGSRQCVYGGTRRSARSRGQGLVRQRPHLRAGCARAARRGRTHGLVRTGVPPLTSCEPTAIAGRHI
jgi:anti-sigma factor RsiW